MILVASGEIAGKKIVKTVGLVKGNTMLNGAKLVSMTVIEIGNESTSEGSTASVA